MKFKLIEDIIKYKYRYTGPVYTSNGLMVQDANEYTTASSKEEAKKNFENRFRKQFKSRYILIEPYYIEK